MLFRVLVIWRDWWWLLEAEPFIIYINWSRLTEFGEWWEGAGIDWMSPRRDWIRVSDINQAWKMRKWIFLITPIFSRVRRLFVICFPCNVCLRYLISQFIICVFMINNVEMFTNNKEASGETWWRMTYIKQGFAYLLSTIFMACAWGTGLIWWTQGWRPLT